MDNYNPRQNTRMRWKDARGLEKIKVVEVKNYNLANTETYEKVSTINELKELINVIKNMKDYSTQFPLILVNVIPDDSESHTFLCVIPYDEQSENNKTIHYTEEYPDSIVYYTLTYDVQKDTINIIVENEKFLTEDNVKTIFGQDITGTGNITLFRHQLALTADEYLCNLEVYSSSNLKVDSIQDLTTLLKPTTNSMYIVVSKTGNAISGRLYYTGSVWKIDLGGNSDLNVSAITDIVTTI